MKKTSLIIEGVDRLGKSTLIQNIRHKLGFFNVIHYAKPQKLDFYQGQNSLLEYQRASFESMFKMLSSDQPFIMDRGHLGECVYANRYRGYKGDYVMDMDRKAVNDWHHGQNPDEYPAKLILLTTSDFSFIQDDGLSFDFTKKEEEQADFVKAFEKSALPKVKIDVSNGKGGYKHPLEILVEVLK